MSEQMRNVEVRTLRNLVSAAFFTWQSGVIIALAIILFGLSVTPFGWWQPAFWLLFGLVSEGLYLFATVTDPQAQQVAIKRLLTERYNPLHIRNPMARRRLEQSIEYYSAIQKMSMGRTGASRAEFEHVLGEIDDWIAELYKLGKRIDSFEENDIINRDRRQSSNEMDALERRLKAEADERVKEEVRRSIKIKQAQLDNLRSLEANIKRADIQMDNTLAALGTIYAQMQLIGSKDIDRSNAQRLRSEIHDQVMELQDTIAAIDEVQQSNRVG